MCGIQQVEVKQKHVLWMTYVRNIDGHICVFPQCQNLLKNNKFTSYINLFGFNSPSTPDFTWHLGPLANMGSFIPILITNISSQITYYTIVCVCVCVCVSQMHIAEWLQKV
jgi:hypothetical protein